MQLCGECDWVAGWLRGIALRKSSLPHERQPSVPGGRCRVVERHPGCNIPQRLMHVPALVIRRMLGSKVRQLAAKLGVLIDSQEKYKKVDESMDS
jgi:hypothetical protein